MLRTQEEQQDKDELATAARELPHHSRANVIGALRKIVADKQAARVGGCLVDLTTASVILKVHDALNEKNRANFASRPIKQMAAIAWKLIK